MSADSDTLRVIYPEFADATAFPDATLDTFIAFALAELDVTNWGTFLQRGRLALAAHMLKTSRISGAASASATSPAGQVTSIKTGDEQINYSVTGASSAPGDEVALRSTIYGLEYLRLRDRVPGGPLIII